MVKSPAKKKPGHPDFSGGVNSAKSSIIPEGNYCLQAPRPRPLLRLFCDVVQTRAIGNDGFMVDIT